MLVAVGSRTILKTFERKALRTILGTKNVEDGKHRPLMNYEIERETNGENIVKAMKAQQIRWLGHIMRGRYKRIVKQITMWKPNMDRAKRRPKVRW